LNAAVVQSQLILTEQGFESTFGVNYLGHYYFTKLLLHHQLIRSSSQATPKIIIVTSEMHQISKPLVENELGCVTDFSISSSLEAYAYSKLCLTTFAVELAQRLQSHSISVSLYDPGPVNTEIARNSPSFLKPIVKFIMQATFKTAEASAKPIGYLAVTSPPPAHYMLYWKNATVSNEAVRDSQREMLWKRSELLIANRSPLDDCLTPNQ